MMYGKKKPAAKTTKKAGGLKTCATCPNPRMCKAKGKCMKKMGRK